MSERGREREADCFISCDVKQDGGFLRGIKQQEEEKGCGYRRWCHFDFEATEKKKKVHNYMESVKWSRKSW